MVILAKKGKVNPGNVVHTWSTIVCSDHSVGWLPRLAFLISKRPWQTQGGHGICTLWLFNIAIENGPFIDDFPIKTYIYSGFSMAMLNGQSVCTDFKTFWSVLPGGGSRMKPFVFSCSSAVPGSDRRSQRQGKAVMVCHICTDSKKICILYTVCIYLHMYIYIYTWIWVCVCAFVGLFLM